MIRLSHAQRHRIDFWSRHLSNVCISVLVAGALIGGLPGFFPSEFIWAVALVVCWTADALVHFQREREFKEWKATPKEEQPDTVVDQPFCTNLRCDKNLTRLARRLADDAEAAGRLDDAGVVFCEAHWEIGERLSKKFQEDAAAGL